MPRKIEHAIMNGSSWFLAVRALHIAAGTIALFVGPGAMFVRKGGHWHRTWGKIYVAAMAGVAVSAVGMSLWHDKPFLFAVAIFSFYLSFSGWRTLRRKGGAHARPGLPLPDLLMALSALAAGIWLAFTGVQVLLGSNGFGSVLVAFGGLCLALSSAELRDVFRVRAKGKWLGQHIGRMLGAYTATLTAFSAVNFHFMPPLLAWLWPTIVMGPLIALTIRRYRKPQNRAKVEISGDGIPLLSK